MSGMECPATGRTSSEAALSDCQLSPPKTCGSSASGGRGGNAFRRETTSSITRVMSVPTSKVRPTPPRPRFDSERISTSPGRPRIASSMGSIRASSSSAGAASRQLALTKSSGRRVSGSSWMGRRNSPRMPNSRTMAAAAATAAGFCMLRSDSRIDPPAVGHGRRPQAGCNWDAFGLSGETRTKTRRPGAASKVRAAPGRGALSRQVAGGNSGPSAWGTCIGLSRTSSRRN